MYPSVFEAFRKGYFTVKNSHNLFSNIGVYQTHEKNNKLIKIEGGAIGILYNPNALLRWAVAGPVVAQICQDAENIDATRHNHHEDTDTYEREFRCDFDSLYVAFLELGNPFTEEEENIVQLCSQVHQTEKQSKKERFNSKVLSQKDYAVKTSRFTIT